MHASQHGSAPDQDVKSVKCMSFDLHVFAFVGDVSWQRVWCVSAVCHLALTFQAFFQRFQKWGCMHACISQHIAHMINKGVKKESQQLELPIVLYHSKWGYL